MEGTLNKWTNVMKGWQLRWFMLDDHAGLLSYYTSKEKMMRGSRRGCIRLRGAVVGIDDDSGGVGSGSDDTSTVFTVTVDGKLFHLQARDVEERDAWLLALETAISRATTIPPARFQREVDGDGPVTMSQFDRRLVESDAYLQLLIQQATALDRRKQQMQQQQHEDSHQYQQLSSICQHVNSLLDSIKHTIVRLQIAKNEVEPVVGVFSPSSAVTSSASRADVNMSRDSETVEDVAGGVDEVLSCDVEIAPPPSSEQCVSGDMGASSLSRLVQDVPVRSYSSSEDENWFDTNEAGNTSSQRDGASSSSQRRRRSAASSDSDVAGQVSWQEFDEAYDDAEDDLGSLEGCSSMISHLLSQIRIGMDLTRVVLPTFILERRSLLEMYADFFAHPQLFSSIPLCESPRTRMVQVVKWYLSAFHAGRKSEVAKKPYNPIIGETFRCVFELPAEETSVATACHSGTSRQTTRAVSCQSDDALVQCCRDGPVPWGSPQQVCFIAEQVSHHPPVSAFYAEHCSRRVSFCGHIWTKSKFLGLSVAVHNIGQGCVAVLDHDEEYLLSFPSGYGRSILSVPWIELGGSVVISCGQTGYTASLEFLTKPFYGGRRHRVTGEVTAPGDKKPFLQLDGEWNGAITAKWESGETEMFVDTKTEPLVLKQVKSIKEQDEFESRRLWRHVTHHLKHENIGQATEAKCALEERQRNEAKQRQVAGTEWNTKMFHRVDDNWLYDSPLQHRLPLSTRAQ